MLQLPTPVQALLLPLLLVQWGLHQQVPAAVVTGACVRQSVPQLAQASSPAL